MEIKTKYITPDDFTQYFGIDLDLELKSSANPSDTAEAFLLRIENRIATYLDAQFYRQVDEEYPEFTDYQKEHYSLALLEQAIYVFKNGDISQDSGYDYERGEITSNNVLTEKTIAPNCKRELLLCGLWCRKVKGRRTRGIWNGFNL